MKITKSLKYADFEWDDESKTFTLTEEDGNRVILNKVYAFAFMRFVIRMAQRNWWKQIKKQKKVLDNTPSLVLDLPSLESETVEDLQQSLLFADEELKPEGQYE